MSERRYRTLITIHSIIGTSCFAILVQLMGNELVEEATDLFPLTLPLIVWSMVTSAMYVIMRLIYPPEIQLMLESFVPIITVIPSLVGGAMLLAAMQPLAGVSFGIAFGAGFLYAERNEVVARRQRQRQAAAVVAEHD